MMSWRCYYVLCCAVDDIAIVIAVGGEEKALVTSHERGQNVGVDRKRRGFVLLRKYLLDCFKCERSQEPGAMILGSTRHPTLQKITVSPSMR
jgi:hypothetical protein